MRALAQFAMSGRRQSILTVMILGFLPLLNFLSPAIVALVALRHGKLEALLVLAWAAIPAIGWAILGDVTFLLSMLGVVVLALVLRSTNSWATTLLASVGVGIAALLGLYLQPQMLTLIEQQLVQALEQVANAPELQGQLTLLEPEQLHRMMVMSFATMITFMAVTLLMLARSWQARLYNPGGFREEFHQLRLDPRSSAALFLFYMLANYGPPVLQQSALFFMLPLLIAGAALVHGLVGRRKLPIVVLVVFYSVMIYPVMVQLLVLAALVDSWYDFRSRVPARE